MYGKVDGDSPADGRPVPPDSLQPQGQETRPCQVQVTYSVFQVTGLALAALACRAGAFSLTSFFSLPQGGQSGIPVAGQAPARASCPVSPILTRYSSPPTGGPGAAREGRARLGTRYRSPARLRLGPVWMRLGGAAGDSEPG